MSANAPDFNETQAFEEYNIHPYKGGYDIVLTYGTPLAPSPAICYPISDASSPPPLAPQVLPPSDQIGLQDLPEKAIPNSVGCEDDPPEGFPTVDLWWNLSGFFPNLVPADENTVGGCGYDLEDLRYWGQLRRAAGYIFGHSQGFGEMRIGVDSIGVPIYAYKKNVSETVRSEIGPMRTERVDYHCDFLLHENDCEVDPVESVFSWKPSKSGHYGDQVDPESELVPLSCGESSDEVGLYENLRADYSTHYYGGLQNLRTDYSYPEDSPKISYTGSDWDPSYKGHGNETSTFTNTYYEMREYQQPSHLELEPYRPSWAQCPEYYGIFDKDVEFYATSG